MTSFLQNLIDSGIPCKGCPIVGHWLEIDSPSDLDIAIDID